MYILPENVRRRALRRYRSRTREMAVDERFRGWSWSIPPIDPPYDFRFSLSEIASRYCETMRDIYLHHVEKIRRPTNAKMISGKLYHQTVVLAFENAKRILYSSGSMTGNELTEAMKKIRDHVIADLLSRAKKPEITDRGGIYDPQSWGKNMIWLWNTSVSQIAYSVDSVLSTQPYLGLDALINTAIPIVVEQRLDGRNIGLSGMLSADAYGQEGIVMDIKTGQVRRFHRLATTGYAMVIESIYEYPVDIGCLIYCWFDSAPEPRVHHDVHSIDEPLRQEFLEIRDEAMRLVYNERDPGLPKECYKDCPYWHYCH